MQPANDQDLLKRIKINPAEFAILYDQYYTPVFSYIFRRTGNYEQARDIVADTFLKAYQKINRFEWRGVPISAWLYRIASNEINQQLRKKHRLHSIDSINEYLPQMEGIETERASLEKAFAEKQEFVTIQRQLLLLHIKYQEVIALRFFEQKTIQEISVILNKKQGTIKSLLSRGLEKLRIAMASNSNS